MSVKSLKGYTVPVQITDKVQNQIYVLCNRIHEDEWSGTLFYTVEGSFGAEDFKIKTEEIYLQDIGTSAYTEYDPANPEFIKFLMSRPDLMNMRMGHIHSHNKMEVFFSGTDTDELAENSEFHNYYLSIIVNNRNHIIGKIAFRGKALSETTTLLTFKDTDGSEKVTTITGKAESECVYTYDCDIANVDYVGEEFNTRFFEVLEEKKRKKEEEEKKRKELAQQSKIIAKGFEQDTVGKPYTNPAFKGFDGAKRYRETNLWGPSGDLEDWMGDEKEKAKKKDKKSIREKSRVDGRTYAMLSKLLKLDSLYEGQMAKVLEALNGQFYGLGTNVDPNYYFEAIASRAVTFYIESFPEDQHLLGYNKVMEDCIEILCLHDEYYPKLIEGICDAIKDTMTL